MGLSNIIIVGQSMSAIEEKLLELGLTLPAPKVPVANYLGTKQSGNLLFVSGRVSDKRGAVGIDVGLEEAQIAARDTILDLLSIIKVDIGNLDRINSIISVQGYVHTGPEFHAHSKVIDGASDLLISLLGEDGKHARTATGVAQLPYSACIQINMVLELKS
jgi:enamine deaminase RidA (YjgF/YER057c/UK114 family)